MYKEPFYINIPVGNNAFSYEVRKSQSLFVPSIKKISSVNEIELCENICFEDFDENGTLISGKGLKHIYEFQYQGIPTYLFDNHNHAYFFWYHARSRGLIKDGATLLHIDQHSDMRSPGKMLIKPESEDLEKVFEYTNFELNVGNYIIPTMEEGLIKEVIQIRSLEPLKDTFAFDILNLDLDFFAPELDYIKNTLKIDFIKRHIPKAKIITIATSPFFIEQTLAIKFFHDIFTGEIS